MGVTESSVGVLDRLFVSQPVDEAVAAELLQLIAATGRRLGVGIKGRYDGADKRFASIHVAHVRIAIDDGVAQVAEQTGTPVAELWHI